VEIMKVCTGVPVMYKIFDFAMLIEYHMVLFYRVQSELPFSDMFLEIRLPSAEIFNDLCVAWDF